MKHFAIAFFLLFFAAKMAQSLTPLTSFPSGSYLGQGYTLADDGARGTFASYVTFNRSGWYSIHFINSKLRFYETVLAINSNGFFSAEVTDDSIRWNPKTYTGIGHCRNNKCQLTIDINVGKLRKTIILNNDNNSIAIYGAVDLNNGRKVQWEENLLLIPLHTSTDQSQIR